MIDFSLIPEFLRFLTVPFLKLNFVDIIIIVIIGVYAVEGYAVGFTRSFADFVSFVLSFIFGLTFYDIFSEFLVSSFNIPQGFGNALGFFLAAFFAEVFITIALRSFVLPQISERVKVSRFSEQSEKLAGIIPGVFSAIVLLAFVLTMVIALPISPFLKSSVFSSRLGGPLVSNIQGFDKEINNVFGGAVNDALTFLTVEPKSEELLKLNFSTTNISVDRESEIEMLYLLNKERVSAGLSSVEGDPTLVEIARKHCSDMFERGYFSHYTPEGRSPFDRMAEGNIEYKFAGENLALAPSAKLAMQGLMNSPGHKANILSGNFGKAGIGIIDGGIYGKMFCQEFTD